MGLTSKRLKTVQIPKADSLTQLFEGFPDFSDLRMHQLMLKNHDKYRAFFCAFQENFAGKSVIEIGSGTGILTVLSAASGARKVTGYEKNPLLAQISNRVLGKFKFRDCNVSIVNADALNNPPDFTDVDFVFSETVGYIAFEEGLWKISKLVHTHTKSLTNRPKFWPQKIETYIYPLETWPNSLPYRSVLSDLPWSWSEVKNFQSCCQQTTSLQNEPFTFLNRSMLRTARKTKIIGLVVFIKAHLSEDCYIGNYVTPCWPRLYVPVVPSLTIPANQILALHLLAETSDLSPKIDISIIDKETEKEHLLKSISVTPPLINFALPQTTTAHGIEKDAFQVIQTILHRAKGSLFI